MMAHRSRLQLLASRMYADLSLFLSLCFLVTEILLQTGKSSVINSLTKKHALPVYTLTSSSRGPTTTIMPQEMSIEVEGKTIRFIDTPGFTWDTDKTSPEADEIRARDILLRNKGRIDRLKDPLSPGTSSFYANYLIIIISTSTISVSHLVSRANPEDLMLLYSLPAFPKGDIDAFVSGVARSQQLVRKVSTPSLSFLKILTSVVCCIARSARPSKSVEDCPPRLVYRKDKLV